MGALSSKSGSSELVDSANQDPAPQAPPDCPEPEAAQSSDEYCPNEGATASDESEQRLSPLSPARTKPRVCEAPRPAALPQTIQPVAQTPQPQPRPFVSGHAEPDSPEGQRGLHIFQKLKSIAPDVREKTYLDEQGQWIMEDLQSDLRASHNKMCGEVYSILKDGRVEEDVQMEDVDLTSSPPMNVGPPSAALLGSARRRAGGAGWKAIYSAMKDFAHNVQKETDNLRQDPSATAEPAPPAAAGTSQDQMLIPEPPIRDDTCPARVPPPPKQQEPASGTESKSPHSSFYRMEPKDATDSTNAASPMLKPTPRQQLLKVLDEMPEERIREELKLRGAATHGSLRDIKYRLRSTLTGKLSGRWGHVKPKVNAARTSGSNSANKRRPSPVLQKPIPDYSKVKPRISNKLSENLIARTTPKPIPTHKIPDWSKVKPTITVPRPLVKPPAPTVEIVTKLESHTLHEESVSRQVTTNTTMAEQKDPETEPSSPVVEKRRDFKNVDQAKKGQAQRRIKFFSRGRKHRRQAIEKSRAKSSKETFSLETLQTWDKRKLEQWLTLRDILIPAAKNEIGWLVKRIMTYQTNGEGDDSDDDMNCTATLPTVG